MKFTKLLIALLLLAFTTGCVVTPSRNKVPDNPGVGATE